MFQNKTQLLLAFLNRTVRIMQGKRNVVSVILRLKFLRILFRVKIIQIGKKKSLFK